MKSASKGEAFFAIRNSSENALSFDGSPSEIILSENNAPENRVPVDPYSCSPVNADLNTRPSHLDSRRTSQEVSRKAPQGKKKQKKKEEDVEEGSFDWHFKELLSCESKPSANIR